MMKKKILAIYIEPTPYIIAEINALRKNATFDVDIIFIKENVTQDWSVELPSNCRVSSSLSILLCRDIFVRRKYALVHLNGWNHSLCLSLIILSRLFKIPVSVASDTQLNPKLSLLKKTIKKILYPVLFRFPSLFLPGGTRQANYFRHYWVPAKKIKIAQMTVDVEAMQRYMSSITGQQRDDFRRSFGVEKNQVVFLFVGRLLELKGLLDLIKAFQGLNHDHAVLWIVGDGELRPVLEQPSMQEKNIVYFGRKIAEELFVIYHAADVIVLPSHRDQWGLVVNEAMAAGKPVIVTQQVGCSDDLVIHEKTGLVIKERDVKCLCDALTYMVEHVDERKKMEKATLELISRWTLTHEVANIVEGWAAAINN
jgi:glycosyltransferase involved in cell wall biosynthesis